MSSVSQHRLKDPTDPGAPDVAEVHDATALSVEVLEDLVRSNDIDIVGLTGHINDVRGAAGQASLSDVLRAHPAQQGLATVIGDRKSTRLNSSHVAISYAVFCLKKKQTRSVQTWPRQAG